MYVMCLLVKLSPKHIVYTYNMTCIHVYTCIKSALTINVSETFSVIISTVENILRVLIEERCECHFKLLGIVLIYLD